MERVINQQLLKYLETNRIISDNQYGFRKQRSTGDILAFVTHMWNMAIEKHGESRAIALDISKAFDRVWHDGLLNKLSSLGLPLSLCGWLASFLSNRSLHVAVDGHISDTFTINAGVPQGAILSPTLFLIYINDLLAETNNSIYSFADDSTLVSHFTSETPLPAAETYRRRQEQVIQINEDLQRIQDWGDRNLVQFNAAKTQAAMFTKKANTAGPDIVMAGIAIPSTSQIGLLGVSISNNMSWHEHVTNIAKSASQKLGALFRNKKLYTPQQLLLLYKAQIRPCLEYCSHVWSCAPKHTLRLLDSIQKRAVRLVGDPNLTRNLDSLEHRRTVGEISLFYRYFHGRCSQDLARLIPPRAVPVRQSRQAARAHPFVVQLNTPRTSLFKDSFLWRTASLWNSLPAHLFPPIYNLQQFKSRVNHHLRTHTALRVS